MVDSFYYIRRRLSRRFAYTGGCTPSGAAPTVVAVHCTLGQDFPTLRLRIAFQCTADCIQHIAAIVRFKGKAVAIAIAAVLNGILQTAGFPNNRNGAVAQRHHLGQATRLTLRRHQEQVCAGINLSGQFRNEAEASARARPGYFSCISRKKHLVLPVTGTEDDKLCITLPHQLI